MHQTRLATYLFKYDNSQTDIPKISLELLSSISHFDFPNLKLYFKWFKRQAINLKALVQSSEKFDVDVQMVLSLLLSQLISAEEWVNAGPDGRAEILKCMKGFASRISNSPLKFGILLESYYWTHNYHFNIKLYEKLLCSVFDVLEDGQIIKEAEEIIKILKLTWPILGITQTLHDALYSWLLFEQQRLVLLKSVLTMAVLSGSCFADEYEGVMSVKPTEEVGAIFKLIHIFIEKSIQAAYKVLDHMKFESEREDGHPMALLANELNLIAEKECTLFIPVFHQRYPNAREVSSILLHQFYGGNLAPSLKVVDDLSESTRLILAATYEI